MAPMTYYDLFIAGSVFIVTIINIVIIMLAPFKISQSSG